MGKRIVLVLFLGLFFPCWGWGAVGGPLILDPGSLDFGTLGRVGTRDLILGIKNAGGEPLQITRIVPPSGPFAIVSDQCSGKTLPENDRCSVAVRFAPAGTGVFSGNLSVNYRNPAAGSTSLSVRGVMIDDPLMRTPTEAAAPNAPDIQISTHALDFGSVTVGHEQQRSVTLRNLGTAPSTLGVVTPLAEPFSIVDDGCSERTLAAGGRCRILVRATPAVTGLVQGNLDIPTDSRGTLRVRVSAQGVDFSLPAIVVRDRLEWEEDLNLPFGEIFVGRSVVTTVTVNNIGSAPLAIPEGGVAVNFDPHLFLRSDGCSGQSVPPGGACNIQVRFSPFRAGPSAGAFNIRSDDPRMPDLRVTLSGAAKIAAGNSLPAAPTLIHPDPNQSSLRDTVTFRWQRCDDPDGDQVFYQFFLSKSPGETDGNVVESRIVEVPENLRLAGFGAAALALLGGSALSPRRRRLLIPLWLLVALLVACSEDKEDSAVVEIGNLDPQTTYYWKVMSDDGRGGLAESDVQSFTTR